MPRTKRTLADADANAETAPAAKRPSRGKAAGKENKPPNAKKAAKKDVVKKDSRVPKDADGNTWICLCRPHDNEEDEDDESNESENDAAASKTVCDGGQGPRCMCRRPANSHPDYDWMMTKRGFELGLAWMDEKEKRCQENFDLYIFNDYNGYGTQEVFENMLVAFDKAMTAKPLDVLMVWAQIEGMALLFNGDLMEYNMIDDGASVARFAEIIGTAVLAALEMVIEKGLVGDANGAVRNTGLVLCQFIEFGQTQDDASTMNENGWVHRIVKMADEHGITIKGTPDTEEAIASIRADIVFEEPPSKSEATRYEKAKKKWTPKGDRDDEGDRVWRRWDWTAEFKAFARERGVKVSPNGPSRGKMGGDFYDLTTKKNKALHKQHSLLEQDDF